MYMWIFAFTAYPPWNSKTNPMHAKTYGLGEESVNAKLSYFLIESHFITACAIQITDLPENILQK